MIRRTADPHSVEASQFPQNESNRDALVSSSNRQQAVHNPPPVIKERCFEKLRKLGATPFRGTLDPAEAESWLESIERVLNLMQCTPDKRFDYAVFLLQGDAYNWWKTGPHSLVQPPVLSWNDFLREYRNKYTPEVYKREKHREFIELKQNNMTVAEYELKFTQLSVYAANLVATEEEKCLKFEEGLTYKIRSKLTPYDLEIFPRLIAAAIRAEKLVNEKKALLSSSEKTSERLGKHTKIMKVKV